MNRIFIQLMALFLAGSVMTCSQNKTPEQKTSGVEKTVSSDQIQMIDVDGDSLLQVIRAADAKVKIVNVWATWCQPCREEFPDLLKAYEQTRDKGVQLILVCADFPEQREAARKFLADHGNDFPTYFKTGKDMEFINALSSEWSGALPGTFIYGTSDSLREFWQGKASLDRFVSSITKVLES